MPKRTTALILSILILATATLPVLATNQTPSGLPYDTYNYDYRKYIRFTPAAYVPDTIIRAENYTYGGEPLGKLVNPQDLSRSPYGNLYIADTGNNRIIVLDRDLKNCIDVITTFDNNGVTDRFNEPYGVTVSERGWIYVADRANNRIVVLDQDDNLVQIFANPKSESLAADYVFLPLKVAVDYADRVYCTAQFVFEGIMVFESNG
ncbi:MAG: gluconolactonase, partial [Lachnospiraceae bacterium]|nr:gluconolactonase [Lachnospiraceae bacterium]